MESVEMISFPDSSNPRRTIVLVVATMAAFLTPFMSASVNVALPSIGKEFDLSAVVLGWIATSSILAAAVFLVPFGKISDIIGRKKVFGLGSLIYALSSCAAAIAPSAAVLFAARVSQGLGGAMIFSTGLAMLTSAYPAQERGRVLGINVASTYLGLSLGPVLGGLLTQHWGWRSIFWFSGILGLIVFIIVIARLEGEWAEARGEKFDAAGAVLLGAALVAVMLGFSLLPKISGGAFILVGIAGIFAFVGLENKVKNPVLDMRLFHANPVFAFSNLAALIHYSATFAVGFLLSLHLQNVKGLSPQTAGFVLIAQPALMAVFSPLAGRLSDRLEPRLLASSGMSFSVLGLVLLSAVNRETGLSFIVAALAVLGFGFALFSSPNTNAVMSSVDKKFYGVASATLATMRFTGQMFSMGMAMLIFSLHLGKERIGPETASRFLSAQKTVFLFLAVLCLAGVFASLKRGKLR
jgi:EmrB/QacA subfamily drug resistance transporter